MNKKNFKRRNSIFQCLLLIITIMLFAGCNQGNDPGGTDDSRVAKGKVVLHLSASAVSTDNVSLLENVEKSIAPTEEALEIKRYIIQCTHATYSYLTVEFEHIVGAADQTEEMELMVGCWSIQVYAYNNEDKAIGMGATNVVINPGKISRAFVSIGNIEGSAPVSFTIDVSELENIYPEVRGRLYRRDIYGVEHETENFLFSVSTNRRSADYTGALPSGFYELEITVVDKDNNDYLLATYHTTIALYDGILLKKELKIGPSVGGGSIVIEDAIDRPIEIEFEGIRDELLPDEVMEVHAQTATIDIQTIERIEWRLDTLLYPGESNNTITIDASTLLAGTHELEVIMYRGDIISSRRSKFCVHPFHLTVSLDTMKESYLQGEEIMFLASTSLEVDSYEWLLDGVTIEGETLAQLVLDRSSILSVGSHTVEVRVQKGAVTRSAECSFTVNEFSVAIEASSTTFYQGQEILLTALCNLEADSYEWFLDGSRIDGDESGQLVLGSHLEAGSYLVEVKAYKDGAMVSASCSLVIEEVIIKQITSGAVHCMLVKSDGTLWGWGANYYGQLGDGTATGRSVPVQVQTISDVAMVSCGIGHTLAVKTDGTVWAWGAADYGQLGQPYVRDIYEPVKVHEMSDAVMVAASEGSSHALKSDGTVWSWGNNTVGTLGNGTTSNEEYFPQQAKGLSDVIMIDAGSDHVLALRSDGTVWAWGSNAYGQIGDATSTDRHIPTQVLNLSDIISIEAGWHSGLALKADGTVWRWGDDSSGGGDTPTPIEHLAEIVMLGSGMILHNLALQADGTVWAWGENSCSQLGDGTTIAHDTPIKVTSLSDLSLIAVGADHTMVVKPDQTLWSWGGNGYGQLGLGLEYNVIISQPTCVDLPW